MTLEEIGETFDLTRERVRQIKEKAIRRLKHTSRSKILKNLFRINLKQPLGCFFFTTMKKLHCTLFLAADFANLQRDSEMLNNSEADWFHIDIMDGVLFPIFLLGCLF